MINQTIEDKPNQLEKYGSILLNFLMDADRKQQVAAADGDGIHYYKEIFKLLPKDKFPFHFFTLFKNETVLSGDTIASPRENVQIHSPNEEAYDVIKAWCEKERFDDYVLSITNLTELISSNSPIQFKEINWLIVQDKKVLVKIRKDSNEKDDNFFTIDATSLDKDALGNCVQKTRDLFRNQKRWDLAITSHGNACTVELKNNKIKFDNPDLDNKLNDAEKKRLFHFFVWFEIAYKNWKYFIYVPGGIIKGSVPVGIIIGFNDWVGWGCLSTLRYITRYVLYRFVEKKLLFEEEIKKYVLNKTYQELELSFGGKILSILTKRRERDGKSYERGLCSLNHPQKDFNYPLLIEEVNKELLPFGTDIRSLFGDVTPYCFASWDNHKCRKRQSKCLYHQLLDTNGFKSFLDSLRLPKLFRDQAIKLQKSWPKNKVPIFLPITTEDIKFVIDKIDTDRKAHAKNAKWNTVISVDMQYSIPFSSAEIEIETLILEYVQEKEFLDFKAFPYVFDEEASNGQTYKDINNIVKKVTLKPEYDKSKPQIELYTFNSDKYYINNTKGTLNKEQYDSQEGGVGRKQGIFSDELTEAISFPIHFGICIKIPFCIIKHKKVERAISLNSDGFKF